MSENPLDLSIVIVSYNVSTLLEACLGSLYTQPASIRFEVIVVENASSDDSREMVTQRFPQVRLMISSKNLGFAGANNLAIPRARARYILLLNPDTVVLPDALDELVRFLDRNPQAGAAGSRLLNPDNSLQDSCYRFPTLARETWRLLHLDALFPFGKYTLQKWSASQPHQTDVIQGTSLALRKTALDRIGILDESFFMYSEEVDLCFRLHRAGWKLFYVPASRIIHYGGQSTRQTAEKMFLQLYQSKIHYFRKHRGKLAALIYKGILYLASALRVGLSPLAYLKPADQRQKMMATVSHYVRLIKTLPQY